MRVFVIFSTFGGAQVRVNVFSRRLCMVANRFDARTPNPKTYPGITGSRMCDGWWASW